jgi:hypothetical protein
MTSSALVRPCTVRLRKAVHGPSVRSYKASESAVLICNRTSCRPHSALRAPATSASASAAGCTAPTTSGSWWSPSTSPTTTGWSWTAARGTTCTTATGWRYIYGWRTCGGNIAWVRTRRRRRSSPLWPGQKRCCQCALRLLRWRQWQALLCGGWTHQCCHLTRCRLCTERCDSKGRRDPITCRFVNTVWLELADIYESLCCFSLVSQAATAPPQWMQLVAQASIGTDVF